MLSRLSGMLHSPQPNSFLDLVSRNESKLVEKILAENPDAILEVNSKNHNALWIAAIQKHKVLADTLILFGDEYVKRKVSEKEYEKAARYYFNQAMFYYHKKNNALQSSLCCDQAISCLTKINDHSPQLHNLLAELHFLKYMICTDKTEIYRIKQDYYVSIYEAKNATYHIQEAINHLNQTGFLLNSTQYKILVDDYNHFLLAAYNAHALVCKELGEHYVEEKRWAAALTHGYQPSIMLNECALKHIENNFKDNDIIEVDINKIKLNIAVNAVLSGEAYFEMSNYQTHHDQNESALKLCQLSIASFKNARSYLNAIPNANHDESWQRCFANLNKSLSRSHGFIANLYQQQQSPNWRAAKQNFEEAISLLNDKNLMPKDELDKEMYQAGLESCLQRLSPNNTRSLFSNNQTLFSQHSKSMTALDLLRELNQTAQFTQKTP